MPIASWSKNRRIAIVLATGVAAFTLAYVLFVGWGHVLGSLGYRLGFLGSMEVGDTRLIMADGWFPTLRNPDFKGRATIILYKSNWPAWTPSNSLAIIKLTKEEAAVFEDGLAHKRTKKYAWGEVTMLPGKHAVFFAARGITISANRGYEDGFESALGDILSVY